ncbi:nitrogen permease regulator 2 [Delitschia confertaspora ATCC 74209]|uniref:Nitrogen permease regulator 2 n=1 Tax=Delitschia confertaspora ATCC 74209 TaxID=1513339 RepID=A0A9P4JN73_9PLEO|nr:nitrogen permease regulator 2 [Delitschia confertaspora ATCC 74209]
MSARAIQAIFYTRFHPEKGSRVLHQVPDGSITPSSSPSALPAPLLPFESITSYLIPTQQFCDRLLTFCTNHYRVIGYPVCIREGKYSRNEFMFNFAVVIEEGVADWGCWGEVVRKLGRLLRGLEEQGGFLSREEEGVWEDDSESHHFGGLDGSTEKMSGSGTWDAAPMAGGSKVYALCEMILEDLNNYCECMIPIDDSNTINLKLFPTHAPPAPIHPYQVPLLTISLSSLTSPISSDLTLTRILPYINGINSVSRISQLADTDLSLTRKAVQHLVYYGCVLLLDIFQFSAVYAPTAEIGTFVVDKGMRDECARYVKVPRLSIGRSSTKKVSSDTDLAGENARSPSLSSEAHHGTSISISEASYSTTTASATYIDSRDTNGSPNSDDTEEDDDTITHETLITLYTSLRQGLTLRSFVLENTGLLHGIDIRRFITFGIIKGFLYRVHRYGIAGSLSANTLPSSAFLPPHIQNGHVRVPPPQPPNSDTSTIRDMRINGNLSHKPSISSTLARATSAAMSEDAEPDNDDGTGSVNGNAGNAGGGGTSSGDGSGGSYEMDALPLIGFLDGMHCFDEICTEFGINERVVERKIEGFGDVRFIWR